MKLFRRLFFGDYESFADEKDYKIFFTTNLFLLLGITIHTFYVGIFLYLGIFPMVFVELSSVVVLVISVYINRIRVTYVPALIMCIEIGTNGVLWAMVLKAGDDHYLYTFVALLAVFLFLELSKRQKVFITIFLLICVNISRFAKNIQEIYITSENIEWLSFISLNMVFILLIIALTINQITNEAIKEMHKKTVKTMANEIMHDSLTQLYNRRYFRENEERFHQDAEKQVCCIAMMDLDHFKNINDTYGHDAGDQVLMFFADKMRSEFDGSDVIMRWGGEEFLVLFRDAGIEHTIKKLKRFRDAVRRSEVRLEEETIKITFTAGLCEVESEMTISEAVTQADNLLYHGKAFGRDCICYR